MATLEEITDRFKTAVGADSGLGKSVKFDLKGDGVILIDGGKVTNDDAPADCTILVSKDDFESLAKGNARPHRRLHARQVEGERRYGRGDETAAATGQGPGPGLRRLRR